MVAPRAGAWVETNANHNNYMSVGSSHPVRVRGLKRLRTGHQRRDSRVAPRAGAWVETCEVGLGMRELSASHPVRVRGLKP